LTVGKPAQPRASQPTLGLAAVLALVASCGVAAVLAPAWLLEVSAKEGMVEVVSQAILLVAAAGWAVVRGRESRRALLIALACLVVLGEELDWGLRGPGSGNLHNSVGGASYLLFALPWVWLYGASLGLLPRARWVPPRPDGIAFAVVVAVAGSSLVMSSAWEQAVDELSELMLYVLLAVGGLRIASGR
jgi:hypothetical protein